MKRSFIRHQNKPILAGPIGWRVILGFLAAALLIAALSVSTSDRPVYTPFFAAETVDGQS